MKVRASELHAVKDSNKCIPQEGGDAEMDERDEFMNDVYRRRRMNQHIKTLEKVKNATLKEEMVIQFNKLTDTETKLLADEESKETPHH
ncbi:unnamed protein product [Peronospora farinosa]|uniref:Uncharacterized protein n=1 Tax=Peronospora farinosa TaxID=134698 RepID=A0AAV0T804_9STRA|nr:unnamed protein product [Peronospora farinosa]